MKTQIAVASLLISPSAAALQTPFFPDDVLVAPGAEVNDRFGADVEMDAGWIISALPAYDGALVQEGAVYAWPRVAGGVGSPVEILSPAPRAGGRFGLSIELDDGRLTVGEFRSPVDAAGRVHLYEEQAGNWVLDASLQRTSTSILGFGDSVARDGELIVVGCPGSFVQGQSRGAAEVFRRVGGVWLGDGTLTASDGWLGSAFGSEVGISGERIIVSDPTWRSPSLESEGALYTYEKIGGAWVETARLSVEPNSGDLGLGASLDVKGDMAIAGATFGNDVGAVYFFEYASGAWQQTSRLQPNGLSAFAQFGSSVAREGDDLIVGAPSDSVTGFGTGSGWVIDLAASQPFPVARLVRDLPSINLGISVAVDGAGGYVVGDNISSVAGFPAQTGAIFTYDLPGEISVPYCAPVSNSTSRPGRLAALGSADVLQNDVTLRASQLPSNAFGYFLASRSQGLANQPGGSQGVLCLGGAIGRYVGPGQIQNSGSAGIFDLRLDLGQVPTPDGLVQVVAGETWNFQTWYRDAIQGQATSNFTEGAEISFQ